jgi:hypothetical protein
METIKEQNEFINRLSLNMEEAIENCLEAYRVITTTRSYCLKVGGTFAEQRHISLLQDCAELCRLSANFMLSSSDFSHDLCGICARLCESCAMSCEDFTDDQQLRKCAQICRRCAESCRMMEH